MTTTLTLRSALLCSGAVATMSMAALAPAPIPTPSLLRDGSRFDFEIGDWRGLSVVARRARLSEA